MTAHLVALWLRRDLALSADLNPPPSALRGTGPEQCRFVKHQPILGISKSELIVLAGALVLKSRGERKHVTPVL